METFSTLLAICARNSPVPGEFLAQRPVTRSFDALFDVRMDKRLNKHSWGWLLETPLHPLWRQTYYIQITLPGTIWFFDTVPMNKSFAVILSLLESITQYLTSVVTYAT